MAQEWRPDSDRPNFPDSGNPYRKGGEKTWSFHERYANDAEFKRQVEEGRKRAAEERGTKTLQVSLAMGQGKKAKLY